MSTKFYQIWQITALSTWPKVSTNINLSRKESDKIGQCNFYTVISNNFIASK